MGSSFSPVRTKGLPCIRERISRWLPRKAEQLPRVDASADSASGSQVLTLSRPGWMSDASLLSVG